MTTALRLRASVVWCTCIAALLVGLVSPVRGQEGEPHVILVNVLDRDGNQVPGLSAANFRGEYQKQPVTVVSAAPDNAPRRIALAFDISFSQVAENGEEFRTAEELVSILTPQHRVAIFALAEVLQMHSNLTNDQAELHKALGEARTQKLGAATALYDAVLRLSRGLAGRSVGDAIFLFTDGDDTSSTLEANAAVTAIARTGVRVFVARARETQPRGPWYDRATSWIQSVTEATGGDACWLKDSRKLRIASSMMTEAYRLEVALPRTVDQPRNWELEVIGPDRKKLPQVRLVYPHLVVPLLPPN